MVMFSLSSFKNLLFSCGLCSRVLSNITSTAACRYRCLDLRRQQMQSNLMLRHTVVKLIRRYLEDAHGFVEVLMEHVEVIQNIFLCS